MIANIDKMIVKLEGLYLYAGEASNELLLVATAILNPIKKNIYN